MAKSYKTFKEQAQILIERGMTSSRGLSPEKLAVEIEQKLRYINYYRISAYWTPYLQKNAEGESGAARFREGTYWEAVLGIYQFDCTLRQLLFSAISSMEIALRTQIAHQWSLFSKESSPQAHECNFRPEFCKRLPQPEHADTVAAEGNLSGRERFMARIADNFRKDRHLYNAWDVDIRSGKSITEIPVWSFVEFANFGYLTELLNNGLPDQLVEQIVNAMQFDSVEYFLSGLTLLAYIRNACAHQFRIWKNRWVKMKFNEAPEAIRIELDGIAVPGSTAAALTFCYRVLRAVAPGNTWKEQLQQAYCSAALLAPSLYIDLGFRSAIWFTDLRWN